MSPKPVKDPIQTPLALNLENDFVAQPKNHVLNFMGKVAATRHGYCSTRCSKFLKAVSNDCGSLSELWQQQMYVE